MPITTRTIAKGVPPRLHEPKPKGKPYTQNNTTAKNAKEPGSRKRSTRDDNSDNNSEDDVVYTSDDSASWAKKKKNGKRRRTEPEVELESEVEVVDEDVEPPEKDVEDVEGSVGGHEPPDEQDVSTSHISWTLETHHTLG